MKDKDKVVQAPEKRLRYVVIYLLAAVGLAGFLLMAVSKPSKREVYRTNPFSRGVVNKFQIPAWIDKHEANRRAVHDVAQSGQHMGLGILGDSISEAWNEESKGITLKKYEGVHKIWTDNFDPDKKYRLQPSSEFRMHEMRHTSLEFSEFGGASINLAISGDWVEHLLWRLQDGELSSNLNVNVWLIMIGVNNLNSGKSPVKVAERTLELINYVLEHSSGLIVLQAVLPTCYWFSEASSAMGGHPNSTLLEACISNGGIKETDELNQKLELIALNANKEYCAEYDCPMGFRLLWLDCTKNFRIFADGKQSFDASKFQPDVLHLNKLGYKSWAKCLHSVIQEVD